MGSCASASRASDAARRRACCVAGRPAATRLGTTAARTLVTRSSTRSSWRVGSMRVAARVTPRRRSARSSCGVVATTVAGSVGSPPRSEASSGVAEADRGAAVAAVVRVGELLLLAGSLEVGDARLDHLVAVGAAAAEGAAAREDDRRAARELGRAPAAAGVGAVQVADAQVGRRQQGGGTEHLRSSVARRAARPSGMPWRLLTLLLIGQLLASMDASILTVATPVLQHELDASPTMLQAIFAAYTFTFGVLVVTGARLGDDRGHGNMFLAGLAGFTASSLLCGLAPSAPVLLAGRLVQGACGALMTPQTLQVIQRRFDGDARAKAVGLYSLILSVGVLVGQLVGGVIVTTAGWRWALLINVPAGSALFVAALPRAARPSRPGAGSGWTSRAWSLLSGAMALLLVPLLLGREQGWPAWVWPSLVAGAAGLALFARVERRRAAPLLDLTVLPAGRAAG